MHAYENLCMFLNHGRDDKYSSGCDQLIYLTSAVKETSQSRGQALPFCTPQTFLYFLQGWVDYGPDTSWPGGANAHQLTNWADMRDLSLTPPSCHFWLEAHSCILF